MSLQALLNRTVTITSRAPSSDTDAYGNTVDAETTTVTVGEVQQQQRDESPDGLVAETTWLLIVPAGTNVDTGDEVIVDDLAFEVQGPPWEVRSPRTGTVHHIEATLRRTGGVGGS